MKKEKSQLRLEGPERVHAQLCFSLDRFSYHLSFRTSEDFFEVPLAKARNIHSLIIGSVNWEIHPHGYQDPLFLK